MIETILRKAIKYIQFYCGFEINNLFTCNLKLKIQGKNTIPDIGMRYNNIVYYLLINQYADYIFTHLQYYCSTCKDYPIHIYSLKIANFYVLLLEISELNSQLLPFYIHSEYTQPQFKLRRPISLFQEA